jgi:hypothetical protein
MPKVLGILGGGSIAAMLLTARVRISECLGVFQLSVGPFMVGLRAQHEALKCLGIKQCVTLVEPLRSLAPRG